MQELFKDGNKGKMVKSLATTPKRQFLKPAEHKAEIWGSQSHSPFTRQNFPCISLTASDTYTLKYLPPNLKPHIQNNFSSGCESDFVSSLRRQVSAELQRKYNGWSDGTMEINRKFWPLTCISVDETKKKKSSWAYSLEGRYIMISRFSSPSQFFLQQIKLP